MDGHGISLSRTVSNKALLHPCVPYNPLRAMQHHFVVPKCPNSSKISLSSQVLPCLFWGRCQIPRLGVSCSSGAAFRVCFFCFFWGAMPNPSLGCFLLVGCCLSCLGSFVAFFGGRCQIPRLGVSCSSGAAFRAGVLFWPFLGAMPNPSLGCFLLVGCCLSCLFFFAFFGGRCQIPRLGVSCSSGAAFRVGVLFWPFLGAMPNPSLGCFLLVGCLLNGWSWDQSI